MNSVTKTTFFYNRDEYVLRTTWSPQSKFSTKILRIVFFQILRVFEVTPMMVKSTCKIWISNSKPRYSDIHCCFSSYCLLSVLILSPFAVLARVTIVFGICNIYILFSILCIYYVWIYKKYIFLYQLFSTYNTSYSVWD